MAELSGLLKAAGTLELHGRGEISVCLTTEHPGVARKAVRLLRLMGLPVEAVMHRDGRLRRGRLYTIRVAVTAAARRVLDLTGSVDDSSLPATEADGAVIRRDCCRRSYLRGLFLGCGSVSDPRRNNHWELVLDDAQEADAASQVLFSFGIPARLARRDDDHVIAYLKDGEHIAHWLSVVGAHQALLSFEDVRVHKDVKNRINRLVNAETANMHKVVEAGLRQAEDMALIDRRLGLDSLPEPLQAVAKLRLAHPEASLADIGEMLVPPITKSAVNHRLRRLQQVARRLRDDS